MILFPNCKINLGLNIVARRPDGYHDIETVMYPAPWRDVLEIVPGETAEHRLFTSGRAVDCPPEKNLVMKAVRAFETTGPIEPVDIYLHKVIPDGAGLGGGSADAAFTLIGLNQLTGRGLSDERLAELAATIGADCPFFIYNRPMLATGIGTEMEDADVDLSRYALLIVKPPVSVPTKLAYSRVTPERPDEPLWDVIWRPVTEWRGLVKNDFEPSVFIHYPQIAAIKSRMYELGAIYASMSGSGSAVFGIFERDILSPSVEAEFDGCDVFASK